MSKNQDHGSQDVTLAFLIASFGEPRMYGMLPENPLGQELMVDREDVIAEFDEATFLVAKDGSYGPLTIGGHQ